MRAMIAVILTLGGCVSAAASDDVRLALVCNSENDLYQVLTANKVACSRFDSAAEAVHAVSNGSGVLILADQYPQEATAIEPTLLEQAAKKKLRMFVEYPSALVGIEIGPPRATHVERVVVNSDFFGEQLKKLQIVSVNGLHYLPVMAGRSHLVTARVAGFDHAVYGLPEKTSPILFELPGRDVLVATTCLSRFVTGRYAPQQSWRNIWRAILTWLTPDAEIPILEWTPTVRATYTRDEALPDDYEMQAIRRGIEWYKKSKMIVHPSFQKQVAGKDRIEPLPPDTPVGDGSLGSLEAVVSVIHRDGTQQLSSVQRGDCIDVGSLSGGWARYFHGTPVNYAPHFEAYLWACYLWAYEHTGYDMFLDRAETALKMTMAQHTDGWRWTNGLAQERARIVLPLAWLVRVKGTPENRAMLRKAVDGLIALQDESGAIREELGLPGRGVYPPPRNNAAYGTNEASLIAENGDPVSDLLYTTNFAFLALHEAAAATGDKDIVDAENKLAEFLCRIQIKSETQPAVDGGWFRAFDFERWEHWGCNADHGWGAWCIESGWTQGWIVSVLAMRQMNTALWDLTHGSKIQRHFDPLRKRMLPDEITVSPKTRKRPVEHKAKSEVKK